MQHVALLRTGALLQSIAVCNKQVTDYKSVPDGISGKRRNRSGRRTFKVNNGHASGDARQHGFINSGGY